MGLSDVIARSAARHAHVLLVEVPGMWRVRAAVERAVLAREWSLAFSAADADVLIVCGEPGSRLGEAIELVWQQMPGPRVRVDVPEYDDVAGLLDEAYASLLDTVHHRHDAHNRPTASDLLAAAEEDQPDCIHHGGHEGMDHGGHGGHDDMDMSPGGIPLAEGGAGRDGLEMDILNVRLGPVLPHWPAGLVLRCQLQGDVITGARAELVGGSGHQVGEPAASARRIDNIASLLALADWDEAAAEARRIRDAALEHGGNEAAGARLARLRRKVRRSWLLRWSLRDLRPLSDRDVHQHGIPAEAIGDTYDRLIGMLDRAAAGATGDPPAGPAYSTLHVAQLVSGLDLAAARLVVASLDIHEFQAGRAEHEVSHD